MMNKTAFYGAALVVLGSGCMSDPLPSLEADLAAIHQVRTDLRKLTQEADVVGAMALFTDDAVYMRPGEQADVGKPALQAHWQEPLEAFNVDIEYRADEIEVSGSLAYIRGTLTYTGTPRAGDGAPIVAEQRYIWILRRGDDGKWRIARYIRHRAPQS